MATVAGGEDTVSAGPREMETLIRGVFESARFLSLVRDFTVFADKGEGPFKIVAGYHQFHAGRAALDAAVSAAAEDGDGKVGVI